MSAGPDPRFHLPRLRDRQYVNPLAYTDAVSRTAADPFGFRYRGRSYVVATHADGVTVASSDDLVEWNHHGFALQLPGRKEFWAPCVLVDDGRFYLYVSSAPEGSTDPHDERLMVAVSDDPLGPFEPVRTFFDTFSIDPHVVRDLDGGLWLFYSTNDVMGLDRDHAGTSILVDRLLDPVTPAGEPRVIVVPTLAEEVFEANRFGDGRDWHTIEGPGFLPYRDRAFLTYSGNSYVRHDYFVGYSRAAAGPIGQLDWAKYPNDFDFRPLVRRNDRVAGTGHNSIVVGPNLVDLWLLYHGRDAGEDLDTSREQRTMRLDPLFVDGDRLDTNAPSSGPQDAPAPPTIRDAFDGPALGSAWQVSGGSWFAGDRMATTDAADARPLALTAVRVGSYRAEVDLAATPTHTGARFGIVPVHLGDEWVEVLLDVGSRRARAMHVANGLGVELASAALPRIDLSRFHQVGVERRFDRVAISLDGVPLLDIPAPEGPARVGLTAHHTAARFSGFTLTEHLELWGESMSLLPRVYRAAERADVGREGLTASTTEVALEALDPVVGVTTVHDFELLGRDHAWVRFWPLGGDPARGPVVEAAGGRVRVLAVLDGAEQVLLDEPLPEPKFSVRSAVLPGRLALRAGGRSILIPVDGVTGGVRQRMSLVAARLRGFQRTHLVDA